MKAILNHAKKVSAILITVGVILIMGGVLMGANFRSLYLDKEGVHVASQEQVIITELDLNSFKNIDINVRAANIEFLQSDKYGIELCSYEDDPFIWSLENGNLKVENSQKFKIDFLSFFYKSSYIKIYMPKGSELNEVKVHTSSGKINARDFNADYLTISSSSGSVNIENIIANNIKTNMSSGRFTSGNIQAQNIELKSSSGSASFESINSKNITVSLSSGSLKINGCETDDINIKNNSGKVTADRLTSAKTNINVSSGSIILDGTFTGQMQIKSSSGRITVNTSLSKDSYSYNLSTSSGSVRIDGRKSDGKNKASSESSSENSLNIKASSGSIDVNFNK